MVHGFFEGGVAILGDAWKNLKNKMGGMDPKKFRQEIIAVKLLAMNKDIDAAKKKLGELVPKFKEVAEYKLMMDECLVYLESLGKPKPKTVDLAVALANLPNIPVSASNPPSAFSETKDSEPVPVDRYIKTPHKPEQANATGQTKANDGDTIPNDFKKVEENTSHSVQGEAVVEELKKEMEKKVDDLKKEFENKVHGLAIQHKAKLESQKMFEADKRSGEVESTKLEVIKSENYSQEDSVPMNVAKTGDDTAVIKEQVKKEEKPITESIVKTMEPIVPQVNLMANEADVIAALLSGDAPESKLIPAVKQEAKTEVLDVKVESRKFPRVDVDNIKIVVFSFFDQTSKNGEAELQNLSAGGALLSTLMKVQQEDTVMIPELKLPTGVVFKDIFAKTLRVKSDGAYLQVGIEFMYLGPDEVKALKDYVSSALPPKMQ